jgi:hypothetical protein
VPTRVAAGLRAEGHPQGYASKETLVRGIMSSHVLYVRPERAIENWIRLLQTELEALT